MLNIGRLAPGAADYYVGEVATSAEDYYTGRGEAPGRWVGSLAASIGLEGQVDPAHLRAVLEGQHPFSGEQLTIRSCRELYSKAAHPGQGSLFDGNEVDLARAAARLRMSVARVRQLVWAGDSPTPKPGASFLRARKIPRPDKRGEQWLIELDELERYDEANLARKRRPGYDLTLRPPKSVSVMWALAPEEVRREIRQAHREAVDEVVEYLEAHALFARRRNMHGSQDRVATDGVIAAAFDHRTSRAGDPLLHTHVVTANMTRTVDGSWRAIDGRPIYEQARTAGTLYQAHLRHLLTERLGVQWDPVHNGWAEIDGVPKEVIRAFSKRRDEIEAMVAEAGYTSARAHQTATLATRRAKEHDVDPDVLVQRWKDEAAELGFGPDEIASLLDPTDDLSAKPPERRGEAALVDKELQVEALLTWLGGPEGLTRLSSTFTRGAVVEAIAEHTVSGLSAKEIDRLAGRFLDSDLAVCLSPDPGRQEWVWQADGEKHRHLDLARWSTPELLALEGDLIGWADAGLGATPASVTSETVDEVLEQRAGLSGEQFEMVRRLASPAGSVEVVSGRPGSGKTHALAAYVEALAAEGIPTVGCALAATAAAELESSCRFGRLTGREASTIARLLRQADRDGLPQGVVVIIDEASMVGTRDLHKLARYTKTAGGSIKLIGDPRQHGAVETGGFYRHLCRTRPDDVIELVANRRQQDEDDRTSVSQLREGLVEAALARWDANGRIHRAPTASDAYDALVAHWASLADAGGTDPMVAGPNRIRRELNTRARQHRLDTGQLTGDVITTEAGVDLQVGDWIVTRRNMPTLRAADSPAWVKNGSTGLVREVDVEERSVTVAFEREGVITLPGTYLDEPGWVEHGYARTSYGIQGATLDHALYFASDEASFEEGYVALTRGRSSTDLFIVDGERGRDEETSHQGHSRSEVGLSALARRLGTTRVNDMALDCPDQTQSLEI